ncbi:hypothetical protein A2U01_0072066 [Trifolium medium]|uniref:Uncharacterized protein n=1 Tax=Trifolium medium TaxID=97028 RepID=A0A392SQX5_9FABA|nr:hypothetical protein [Trifolium medium]
MTSLSCGPGASDAMFLPSYPGLSNIWYQSPVDGGAISEWMIDRGYGETHT